MAVRHKSKVNIPVWAIIAVIAIGIIISVIVLMPHSQSSGQSVYSFGKEVANGIDVSEHNGRVDWEKVNASQDFAFIRVGYRSYGDGDIFEDEYAKENLKNAQKSGIPFGVYFYSQAVNEKEAQEDADFVYKTIKKYDVALPVIIDFEYPVDSDGNAVGRLAQSGNTADDNTRVINAFIDRMQEKGYIAGVYASSSIYKNKINLKKLDDEAFIWTADYNSKVTYNIDYTVWQYSETGTCDGVSSKYVDLNYWYE